MEPGIIWAIIATVGFFVVTPISWVISGNRNKKALELSKRQHEENQERMKNSSSLMENLMGVLKASSTYTPEQKELMIGTAHSVIHTLSFPDSGNATPGMTATVESSITPIDPLTGEPRDKGPGYPGG